MTLLERCPTSRHKWEGTRGKAKNLALQLGYDEGRNKSGYDRVRASVRKADGDRSVVFCTLASPTVDTRWLVLIPPLALPTFLFTALPR